MMDIIEYGYLSASPTEEGTLGRVTAVHKERVEVGCAHGIVYARLKSAVYFSGKEVVEFPTTGDFVQIQYNGSGDSQIIKTFPRKSYFSRRDPTPGRGEQAVAANFDYVFIIASLNFDFNVKRLERYLTLSWQSGGVPVVVLTKADLVEDYSKQLQTVKEIAFGVDVFAVSAKTGYGIDQLSEYLKPRKTIVFLGSSGVGKSSLVNALAGEELMAVNSIREDDSKGRHTTTHRQLIMLASGVMMIDTPGMRELGMWDVSSGLGQSFADVEGFFDKCKFSDCKHQNEPGCAVKEAITNGTLPYERWESYLKLKREAKFAEDKTGFLREKEQWHKSISKSIRQNKKNGGKR